VSTRPSAGIDPLPVEGRLPGFDGATGWLNTGPLTTDGLRGRVVLVDFWTLTCINWLRTLGYVRAWAERYRGAGLVVVGVHTPEFPFEGDAENVRRSVASLNVPYPVAIDSGYEVWRAFANHYWPAVYTADVEGRIRFHHFGEGAYDQCELVIRRLLGEGGLRPPGDGLVSIEPAGVEAQADWTHLESPETYLGSEQGRNLADSGDALPLNHWALAGDWAIEPRACVLNGPSGRILFRFHARDVNLVLRSREGTPLPFRVLVDGQPPGNARGVDVDNDGNGVVVEPRLYQLIREPGEIVDRTFEVAFDAPGAEAYVFTFG
jgi:thiol-disulfide isomerase/thioredoxin